MTDLKPPELFSQRPEHMQFVQEQFARAEITRMRSYRIRRFATCVVLVAALCGLIYGIVKWDTKPTEIPTIEADGSLKQKPEQPGGLDVPNQDVLAYQQLDNGGNNQPAQDHMLPPPETPQASPPPSANAQALPPAPTVTLPPVPKVEDLNAPSIHDLAPAPITVQQVPVVTSPPQQASSPPAPAKQMAQAPASSPAKEDAEGNETVQAPAAAAHSPAKSASTGKKNYRVQLAHSLTKKKLRTR